MVNVKSELSANCFEVEISEGYTITNYFDNIHPAETSKNSDICDF